MYKFISLPFLLLMSLNHKQPIQVQKEIIEGKVISAISHKPVSNAHVYVVDGEEEALTNAKGEFRIETIQKFPLIITVDQQGHEKKKLTISNPGKITISITPKI